MDFPYYGGLGWTIPKLKKIGCRWHPDRAVVGRVFTIRDHTKISYYVCSECYPYAEAIIDKKKEKLTRKARKERE